MILLNKFILLYESSPRWFSQVQLPGNINNTYFDISPLGISIYNFHKKIISYSIWGNPARYILEIHIWQSLSKTTDPIVKKLNRILERYGMRWREIYDSIYVSYDKHRIAINRNMPVNLL